MKLEPSLVFSVAKEENTHASVWLSAQKDVRLWVENNTPSQI
jgi:hypothetical protein